MAECAVDSSEEHRAELRRTSEATLSKLGVVSTPDLVAAVPGAGAPPTTLRGQFPTVATP
jgi:hypothetical protein